MNRESVLNYLIAYLSEISYHYRLVDELLSLISKSGNEMQFFKLLVLRLRQLSMKGIEATLLTEFEPLQDGLYSMHMSGKGFNIRIIYSFLPNKQPVLLLAFYERGGKRHTDYTPHMEPALSRLREMKEDL